MAKRRKKVVQPIKHVIPPESIKITYADFKTVPLTKAQAEDIQGDFHYKNQIIRYDLLLTHDELVSTIYHEIFHGVDYFYDLDLPESKEEKVTNVHANGLTTIFKDNPALIVWTIKELFHDKPEIIDWIKDELEEDDPE